VALANIVSAFGLAGAAGLNAYIPLLMVAVLGRLGVLQLSEPFDILTSWWVIAALVILLIIEVIVDKVPGADHINDAVQTFVRPAAGAILFAANAGVIKEANPALALMVGLVLAFGVDAGQAVARPVVNASTMGVGAPVVSVMEDVTSAVASFLAIFAPLLFVIFAAVIVYLFVRLYRGIQRRRTARAVP
jgi:hypothetical protein